jgi:hypothetical protein
MHRVSGVTVTVPPRISSLRYPPTPDSGRKSRVKLQEDTVSRAMEDNDNKSKQYQFATFPGARPDLARTSPPESPVVDFQAPVDTHRITSFRTYPEAHSQLSLPRPADTLAALIHALEDNTWTFPTTMLLPDAPCLSTIRAYLHPSHKTFSPPTSPRYHNGVDWRPEPPERNPLRPMASLSTLSTFQTAPHLQPLPPPFNIFGPQALPSPHFSLTPANNTLLAIFPSSSSFLRAALYAHILTYTFLSSLSSLSHPSLPPISPPFTHSGASIPTTSSYALPSKVVSVLGAPPLAAKPTRVDILHGNVVFSQAGVELIRIEALAERVKQCIGWLVCEMEGRPGGSRTGNGNVHRAGEVMDGLVLRSLVEVVKGCEGQAGFL